MSGNLFRLSIGAKRQVTLPDELLKQLQVPERGELQIEVIGDIAVVTPLVSVPRTHLPEELRRTFESRRGAQTSDIPLTQFLKEIGYKAPAEKPAAAPRQWPQEGEAGLTKNERETVSHFPDKATTPPTVARKPRLTPREAEILEQIARGKSIRQIASDLGMALTTVKAHRHNIEEKLGELPVPAKAAAESAGG